MKKVHECMERDGKVSGLYDMSLYIVYHLFSHTHPITWYIGIDTCFCSGKSPGTLYPIGDILVSETRILSLSSA